MIRDLTKLTKDRGQLVRGAPGYTAGRFFLSRKATESNGAYQRQTHIADTRTTPDTQ